MSGEIRIHADYAGGNIHVVGIQGNRVRLEQELRDTTEWWFYWNFAVKVRQSQEVVFEFTNGEVIGPWGPAVSKDGVNWGWLGADSVISRESFRCRLEEDEQVYFSFCLPYQAHHFERFYTRIAGYPLVERDVLALSEQLRPIPLLRIGNPKPGRHIVFTCRHHACESTPAYLLEGLLECFLRQPNSRVLDQYLIHFIPFVDIDGVENGDQGKSRAPHDHNRDYIERPIYRSTSAIIEYVSKLPLAVGIDFHGPYKWGGRNDYPFMVKSVSPGKEEMERLAGFLQSVTQKRSSPDKIVYDPAQDIEAGEEWNVVSGKTCSNFYRSQGARLAFTLEFPYFGIGDTVFTVQNSRQFGEDVAQALEAYLFQE